MATATPEGTTTTADRGRPRRPGVDEAVLTATIELLREVSFSTLSMEMVAQRAGVAKPTVYRRWPSKAALVVDLIARYANLPEIDQGDLDYKEFLWRATIGAAIEATSTEWAHVIPSVVGESMAGTELGALFRECYTVPRRRRVEEVIASGVAQGRLRADLDPSLVVLLLLGPVTNAWVLDGRPIDRKTAKRLFEEVWSIISS